MSRQEKRSCMSDDAKKNKADKRKTEPKAKKAMGKAKARS